MLRACFCLSVAFFGSSLESQPSVTYDVRDLGADIETADRNPGTCLVTDVVLDQSMMRWALHAYALIAVCDLRCVSCQLLKPDAHSTYLVVVNPVVLADRINAIVASEIGSTDGEMVHFDVPSKLEDEMELRTVDQYEVVEARIDWRHNSYEARTIGAGAYQYCRATSNRVLGNPLVGISVQEALSLDSAFSVARIELEISGCGTYQCPIQCQTEAADTYD